MSDAKASTSHVDKQGGRVRPDAPDLSPQRQDAEEQVLDILHLAELVPLVRAKFAVERNFSDDAILASLQSITAVTSDRERSEAAFQSNLGRYLDCSDQHRDAGLPALIAMLPRPRS